MINGIVQYTQTNKKHTENNELMRVQFLMEDDSNEFDLFFEC